MNPTPEQLAYGMYLVKAAQALPGPQDAPLDETPINRGTLMRFFKDALAYTGGVGLGAGVGMAARRGLTAWAPQMSPTTQALVATGAAGLGTLSGVLLYEALKRSKERQNRDAMQYIKNAQ
jgi:hypothetical protein